MAPFPVSDEEIIRRAYHQMDTLKKVDAVKGCWLYTGNTWGNGYGRFSGVTRNVSNKVNGRVHICSWLRYVGKVPKGKMICHACFVKRCFNPRHLYAGTNQQNQKDAVRAGVFALYWTPERRAAMSAKYSGSGNPMYGVRGKDAPCYGRRGSKHPMYGKHHSDESKRQTSESLKATFFNPKIRAKISKASKSKWADPKFRRKMSRIHRLSWQRRKEMYARISKT